MSDFITIGKIQFHKRIKDMKWTEFKKTFKDNMAMKKQAISLEGYAKKLGIKVPTPKKNDDK